MKKAVINLIYPERGNVIPEFTKSDVVVGMYSVDCLKNANDGEQHDFLNDDEIKIVVGDRFDNAEYCLSAQARKMTAIIHHLSTATSIEYDKIEIIFISSESWIPRDILSPKFFYHYIKISEFGDLRSCHNLTRLQEYSWKNDYSKGTRFTPMKVDSYGCGIELLNQIKIILEQKPIENPSILILNPDVYDYMYEDIQFFMESYFKGKSDYIKIVLDESDLNQVIKEYNKFDNCFFLSECAEDAVSNHLMLDVTTKDVLAMIENIHIISAHYDIIRIAYSDYHYNENSLDQSSVHFLMENEKVHFYIPDVFGDELVLDKEKIQQQYPSDIENDVENSVVFDAYEYIPNNAELIPTQVGKEISC